ncbi:unnamed protein product, partial [marine sediment metagenome]
TSTSPVTWSALGWVNTINSMVLSQKGSFLPSSEFLAVVNPQLAIISVGVDNRHGHPSPTVMERLKTKLGSRNIYRTDEQGTIEFITDGDRLWVKVER